MKSFVMLACFVSALVSGGVDGANFETAAPFYGQKYADIVFPRGLLVDEAGDLLVVSQTASRIIALVETENSDGTVSVNQITIVDARAAGIRINHGIAYHQGFLYASNAADVYRWPYVPGQQTIVTTPAQTVVRGMPTPGHFTRTLAISSQGFLYVSLGSDANVDPDSSRSRILTFNLNQAIPEGGIDYIFGGIFADGLRNEVGISFDLNGVLWGVENAAGNISRPDLGDNIHIGNPAEELNKFDQPVGTHYGYPYCFSTHDLPGYDAGTQFVMLEFMDDGVHTDAWCRNTSNNWLPVLSMPAHTAPLDIQFYNGRRCDEVEGSFPCSAIGDAVVAYHGSFSMTSKVGYRVGWLKFRNGEPTGEDVDILYDPNLSSCTDCLRPVNAVFNNNGHLFVSADESNEIFKITYNTPPRPISPQ